MATLKSSNLIKKEETWETAKPINGKGYIQPGDSIGFKHDSAPKEDTDDFNYCKQHDWYYPKHDRCIQCKVNEGGLKYDTGKIRWDLIAWDVIEDLAKVLTYGAKIYKPNNWQKNPKWKYEAAYMRHYVAWLLGEDNDPQSGLPHLAHAMCNLMFLSWQDKHRTKTYP